MVDAHGVDAVAHVLPWRELEIERGETETVAATGALVDASAHPPPIAEILGRAPTSPARDDRGCGSTRTWYRRCRPARPHRRQSRARHRARPAPRSCRCGPCRRRSRGRPPRGSRPSPRPRLRWRSLGAQRRQSRSKPMTKVWSRPSASSSSSFNGSGVSRKNGVSGAKNSRGCGSNTTAPERRPSRLGDAMARAAPPGGRDGRRRNCRWRAPRP